MNYDAKHIQNMKKVFIAGGASFDSIIYLPEFPGKIPQTIHQCKFNETIGSTGSGKALNLCRLGFNVSLHAMIGNDIWGNKIQAALTQPNLQFTFDFDENGTERHTNLMNAHGERISIFTNTLTIEPKLDYNKFNPYIKEADYVIVNLADYSKKLLPLVKEQNKPIWTDLHDYDGKNPWHQPFVDYADYVFLSSDNLPDYKPFMIKMIEAGKKFVVVTHGKNGSTALTPSMEWIEIPALTNFELVDSNGAGDAYFSGFLYAFDKGMSINDCMKYAALVGALCINSRQLANDNLSENYLKEYLS